MQDILAKLLRLSKTTIIDEWDSFPEISEMIMKVMILLFKASTSLYDFHEFISLFNDDNPPKV